MKRIVWFVCLLVLLIGGGVTYSRLQQPEEEAAARLVGALGFIEQQIERSSHDILDANPFVSPEISSLPSANTYRVAGRVKLLSREVDSGLERSHVEPYHATVENLCKPYTDKACWRLHALEIEGAAVANQATTTMQAGSGVDARPSEAPAIESAPNEAGAAGDTTASAVTLPIETPEAKRSETDQSNRVTDESNRAPHESAFTAALPTRPLEWPSADDPLARRPSAGPSSDDLADGALPVAPEPPTLAQSSRQQDIGGRSAQRAGTGPADAADETHAGRANDQPPAPSIGDSEEAAALAQREQPPHEQVQTAAPERPFATMSVAAREAERRNGIAGMPSERAIAAAKTVADRSQPAANPRPDHSGQAVRPPAATESPQDSAVAAPDTAPPPVTFPDVTSDRLVASAADEPIPISTETRSVASLGGAPAATDAPTPPASLAPRQPAVSAPENAPPDATASVRSPAPQPATPLPLTEAERVELEQGLAHLGFYPGPADGVLDRQSEEAIRAYQDFAALPTSGRPDRALFTEVRQLAETVVLLADDREQEPAQSGADEHPTAAKATLRAMAAARPKLAEAAPPEPAVRTQPLPSTPPRKPQSASPARSEPTPARSEPTPAESQPAEPKVVASLEARPLAGTPVVEPPVVPQPRPTTVAFTVDALPNEIRRAIEVGSIDARLASGHTPLTSAIVDGRQDAVAALLDHGANPNLSSEDDATALMYAAWAGDVVSVKLLLQAGAAPNHKNLDGKTALMAASATGQAEIAHLLLEAGADPDLQALKGWTALMYAVWRDQTEVVRLLLKHRANILLRNDDDETAVDIAAERSRDDIRVLLVNASGAS